MPLDPDTVNQLAGLIRHTAHNLIQNRPTTQSAYITAALAEIKNHADTLQKLCLDQRAEEAGQAASQM